MIHPPDPLHIAALRYAYPDSDWNLKVDDLSLRQGELTAVIGPNGSGKSTLLKLAAGILKPSSGKIYLSGRKIEKMDRRSIARILGYLPQSTPYEFDHRVVDVVCMGRYPHLTLGGFMQDHDMEIIEDSLRQTDALSLRNRRLSQLSGGERQRVLLASVLAQEPSILLLDEPANALDFHHQIRLFGILRRLVRSGFSAAVILHDLNFASLYCERIILMNQGRIVSEGKTEDVLKESIVQSVYGSEILMAKHPQSQRPVVFPRLENPS
ncbi:MAG: ABC transporter ATP-binding protein [Candidatus Omnitrophica bacterium]|nr:ABC transporter ATP-binding protein [Candidatus Omnitrophota bacterium]